MQSSVDEVLGKSWEAFDTYRTGRIEEGLQELEKKVKDALADMEREEEDTFYAELPRIETDASALLQKAKQFREGVEMWRWKAQVSVEMLEEKQRTIAYMVEDASKNFEYRTAALQRLQEERLAGIRQRCGYILQNSLDTFSSALPDREEAKKNETDPNGRTG